MAFVRTRFNAIKFFLISIVVRCFGDLVVLHHAPNENGATRKLTCVSEDDDTALIWNYSPEKNDPNSERNIFTNFQPAIPRPKNPTQCALWNSTQCLAKWENISGWDVADSFSKPMGPVFDYRWEGFKEFVFDELIRNQEYQYVGRVKESSGTGVSIFSVRGYTDSNIFLCERKNPSDGPCLWISIGSSGGKRSTIRSCLNGAPGAHQSTEKKNCENITYISHEGKTVLDAYEWRTFKLEWNSERRIIKVFDESDAEPLLEGKTNRWHPVSYLSIKSESPSRVRFHFYEYLLTQKNNAVISTTEFIQNDKNLCIGMSVGLCPKCELNFLLVDSTGKEILIKSISGVENFVNDKLLTWRLVKLNTTLPVLNSKLIKLKMVNILVNNGGEGLWAIDNFRSCRSVVGMRESTITTRREIQDLMTPFWPTVKCQKLSYTANFVVDSASSSPYLDKNPTNLMEEVAKASILPTDSGMKLSTNIEVSVSQKSGGLLLDRSARSLDTKSTLYPTMLEIYEADTSKMNTISIRLSRRHPADEGTKEYAVFFKREGGSRASLRRFDVGKEELECSLWEDCVCLVNIPLSPHLTLHSAALDNNKYEIEVFAVREGTLQTRWTADFSRKFYVNKSTEPANLTSTSDGHGIVTIKWGHPWFPYTRISKFYISISYIETNLTVTPLKTQIELENYDFITELKQYQTHQLLMTSTHYNISVLAVNQDTYSQPAWKDIWTMSGVAFATGEKLKMTNNGTLIDLQIPAVVNFTSETRIIVNVKEDVTCTKNQSTTSLSPSKHTMGEWIAAEYKVNNSITTNLTIDGIRIDGTKVNCFLHPGNTYEITVAVIDKHTNKSDTLTSLLITLPINVQTEQALIWIIILPIIAICLLLLFVLYRKRRKAEWKTSKMAILPITSTGQSTAPCTVELPRRASSATINRLSTQQCAPDVVPCNPNSHSVKVEEFEEYVKEALSAGWLNKQYEMFTRGLTKPCDYGGLPANVPKNRYRNLTAYDDTRVVLNKTSEDEHSDYINASYIQGYSNAKAYIATQGPLPKTVKDFWRMIWQENVRVICMLANVIEGGKKKCEQYWPAIGTKVRYGNVIISNTKHSVFADYTIRTFRLRCQREESREVFHLHYTGWPDHGIPMYTQSLVSYLKKLQDTPTGNGPVIVHCSAGVGRTGTIILCDICVKQAAAEKIVDVPTVTVKMREERANMVDSAQQYLLAHLTIVESLFPMPTQIPCNHILPAKIEELRKRLPSDMQRLSDTVWQDRALHLSTVHERPTTHVVVKDEIPKLVEGTTYEPESEASPTIDNDKNCINAVSVDGVKMKTQYLASPLPSSSSLPEFWKMIAEREIEMVVVLQRPDGKDSTFCDIIPDESIFVPVPYIQVEPKTSLVEGEHYSVNKLLLTYTSEDEVSLQPVTIITCTGWKYRNREKPPSATALVSLWRASEKISRKESPTLVLCHDGTTGCGLYLALSFLLERMAVERECDVISAVRAVRRSNPGFVQSLEQFQYLYDAAEYYTKCFETYANFS